MAVLAGDNDPALIHRAFAQLAHRADVFLEAWRNAGLYPVGHIVWKKRYSSSIGFLKYRHEQAYLLAKGRPKRPQTAIPDVLPWQYTGNRAHPTEKR